MTNKNYNNGNKKKGIARPNLDFMHKAEQWLKNERKTKGLFFGKVHNHSIFEQNEDSLYQLYNKTPNSTEQKYCILKVVNNLTGEYHKEPYIIRTENLEYTPKVNHKKINKDIKKYGIENFTFSVENVGAYNSFFQCVLANYKEYTANTDKLQYNKNVSIHKNFKYNQTLLNSDYNKYLLTEIAYLTKDLNLKYFNTSQVKFLGKNFLKKTPHIIGNTTLKFSIFDLESNKTKLKIKQAIEEFEANYKEPATVKNDNFTGKNIKSDNEVNHAYIVVNKTMGTYSIVPKSKLTSKETFKDYLLNNGNTKSIKEFNRGDSYELIEHTFYSKKEFHYACFKGKHGGKFARPSIKIDINDTSHMSDMIDRYQDYKNLIENEHDINCQSHLNKVYSELTNFISKHKRKKKIDNFTQTFVLKHFNENQFLDCWKKQVFHKILCDDKMFIKKFDQHKLSQKFQIRDIRINKEDQRRALLIEAQARLDNSQPNYTSIKKQFLGCKTKRATPRPIETINNDRSVLDSKSNVAINDAGSHDQKCYIDGLIEHFNHEEKFWEYQPESLDFNEQHKMGLFGDPFHNYQLCC